MSKSTTNQNFKTYRLFKEKPSNISFLSSQKTKIILQDNPTSKSRSLQYRLESAQKRINNIQNDQKSVRKLINSLRSGLEENEIEIQVFDSPSKQLDSDNRLSEIFENITRMPTNRGIVLRDIIGRFNLFRRSYSVLSCSDRINEYIRKTIEDNQGFYIDFLAENNLFFLKVIIKLLYDQLEGSIRQLDSFQNSVDRTLADSNKKNKENDKNIEELNELLLEKKNGEEYINRILNGLFHDIKELVTVLDDKNGFNEEIKGFIKIKLGKMMKQLEKNSENQENYEEIQAFSIRIDEMQTDFSILQSNYESILSENKDLKHKLAQTRYEISELSSSLLKDSADKESIIQKLSKENQDLQKKNNMFLKENSELESKFEEHLTNFKKELQKSRQIILEMTENYRKSESECDLLRLKLNSVSELNNFTCQNCDKYQKTLISLIKNFGNLNKDNIWNGNKILQIIEVLSRASQDSLNASLIMLKEDLDGNKDKIIRKKKDNITNYKKIIDLIFIEHGIKFEIEDFNDKTDEILLKIKENETKIIKKQPEIISLNKNFLPSDFSDNMLLMIYLQSCSLENMLQSLDNNASEPPEAVSEGGALPEINEISEEEDETNTQHSK